MYISNSNSSLVILMGSENIEIKVKSFSFYSGFVSFLTLKARSAPMMWFKIKDFPVFFKPRIEMIETGFAFFSNIFLA